MADSVNIIYNELDFSVDVFEFNDKINDLKLAKIIERFIKYLIIDNSDDTNKYQIKYKNKKYKSNSVKELCLTYIKINIS